MSDNAVQLPSLEKAAETLFEQIHARVFFNKLAQYGYVPQTEAEAAEYLRLGEQIMQIDPHINKQAEAQQGGLVFEASNALNRSLEASGFGSDAAKQAHLNEVAAVVDELAEDADLYNSVLSFKQAEAASYVQEILNNKATV